MRLRCGVFTYKKLVDFERQHNFIAASCVLNQPRATAKFARPVCLRLCLHFREMLTPIHNSPLPFKGSRRLEVFCGRTIRN